MRELAGDHQEVVVHDLRNDDAAATLAAEQGIKAVPAVVVDGRLLGCCSNAGPDRDELVAAGVGPAARSEAPRRPAAGGKSVRLRRRR